MSTEFLPGDLFANRYRMVTRIGRGGMGDVWRADDLVLDTPVALKLILSASADARLRILNEVRLARRITHPSVCRVFDVGEADGQVFFSMELVDGEDLATLLRHVGRLPSEKVIDIAHQLCGGLAAAHAQGVLHRDLKPANILIDDAGRVRITDFGIAVTRTDSAHHTLIGTPRYMAPEQQVQGTALSEQTDIYSLGVVLYELLVGPDALHSVRGSEMSRPSSLVSHVDLRLERAIIRALSRNPGERPASAMALAATLPAVSHPEPQAQPSRLRSISNTPTSKWIAGTAFVAGVAVLGLAASSFFSRSARALTDRDTIILADFVNTTGEPVFDGTLKVALAVALEQSPFLKVFPDERVREALRLMERSPDERVTGAIAREVAQREQLKALLTGSIGSMGRNYVMALEAINAGSGDVMAREQVEAASKEDVLGALGRAASTLREKLGESLSSIQRYDVPLPRATTPSLEALHAYALALDEGRISPRRELLPQLKRALELDPDFAMAQATLSGFYANMGQSALAPALSKRAFELRDRVSERERFFISWRYYRDAIQAWDKGLELARSWITTYPREPAAFNSLGFAAETLGQYEVAIEPLREAIRLDPRSISPPETLGAALTALNRFDDAKSILGDARKQQNYFVGQGRVSYLLAFIQGDAAMMTQHLNEAMNGSASTATWASDWEARISAFLGRMTTAHGQFQNGIRTVRQNDLDEMAAHFSAEDAESHAVVGQCDDTRTEAAASMALSRDNFTLERAGRALALCGAAADASRLADELAIRFPDATLTTRVELPVIAATLALRSGDSGQAVALLEPVRPYNHVPSAEF